MLTSFSEVGTRPLPSGGLTGQTPADPSRDHSCVPGCQFMTGYTVGSPLSLLCPSPPVAIPCTDPATTKSRPIFGPLPCEAALYVAMTALTFVTTSRYGWRRKSTQAVHTTCHSFQMCQVATGWIPAEMVKFIPLGDRSDQVLVQPAMCWLGLALDLEPPMASDLLTSLPLPTSGALKTVIRPFKFLKKSFVYWLRCLRYHSTEYISCRETDIHRTTDSVCFPLTDPLTAVSGPQGIQRP